MNEPDHSYQKDDADLRAVFAQSQPPAPSREFTEAVIAQLPSAPRQSLRRILVPSILATVVGLLLYPELVTVSNAVVSQLAAGNIESHSVLEVLLALGLAAGAWLVSEYDWLVD